MIVIMCKYHLPFTIEIIINSFRFWNIVIYGMPVIVKTKCDVKNIRDEFFFVTVSSFLLEFVDWNNKITVIVSKIIKFLAMLKKLWKNQLEDYQAEHQFPHTIFAVACHLELANCNKFINVTFVTISRSLHTVPNNTKLCNRSFSTWFPIYFAYTTHYINCSTLSILSALCFIHTSI